MGNETRKCYRKRLERGHFDKYLAGKGVDVGCGEDVLEIPHGTVTPWDRPQGDAQELAGLADESQDFLYSSHCLEHMASIETTLKHWARVIKPGGILYMAVPDYTLYEKELFPSRFNSDHKHTFSLRIRRAETGRPNHWNIHDDLKTLLSKNGVEVIESFLEDDGYDYGLDRGVDQTHGQETLAQICIIGRKRSVKLVPEIAKGSLEPLRIYTGILGQIGDIIMFTPTVRRLKQLFPNSRITFAVSRKYREAGELVAGLPYVDRLFVAESYFEKLTPRLADAWRHAWPVDVRGDDEASEQRRHDIVLETRPRHRRSDWWNHGHQVEECAAMVGVPGPIDLKTEIALPPGISVPEETRGKIVLHNDASIDATKAWPWESMLRFIEMAGPGNIVLIGSPGRPAGGVLDCRGRTTLPETASIIASCRCYVGIDSGPMWIAGSLEVSTIGLYGTSYIPAYGAIQPKNPNAIYVQVEGTLESISPAQVFDLVERST